MKRPEEMTAEELKEFVHEAIHAYFETAVLIGCVPYYNVPLDFIKQNLINNYSRN